MRHGPKILTALAFVLAFLLAAVVAGTAATVIEMRTRKAAQLELAIAGHDWAVIGADGLQVRVAGVAPSEGHRFRVLTALGQVVEASRIVDLTEVARPVAVAPPEFSLEMLRNDDGVSLIGLVPVTTDRAALVAELVASAGGGQVADMLESADYREPEGWARALDFGVSALKALPRSKISVSANRVAITAIAENTREKGRIETDLRRSTPASLLLELDISAPRPVITPFTLRFLIDAEGARFDACSADSERAQARILEAARRAGAQGALGCTIGMGVPSPNWAEAVEMGLGALAGIGGGSITFSDADIALIAAENVTQADFDRVVGELESNLPAVFSLHANLPEKPVNGSSTATEPPEFFATLSATGSVQLRGRVPDQRARDALAALAAAEFGHASVYLATRIYADLPTGWTARVLTSVEALGKLSSGNVQVRPEVIRLSGETDDAQASDTISRLFVSRLGQGARIELTLTYLAPPEPEPDGPSGADCVARLNAVLAENKITFEPGSSVITAAAAPTIDALAVIVRECEAVPMQIGGHTDSQGSEDMNLRLSQGRARAVVVALQQRRVLTGNIVSQGFGEAQPIADNGTEAGREANRRIEFLLLESDAATPAATTGPAWVAGPVITADRPTARPAPTTP
ncbi:MAG: OmpA family protein [Phaeovulum sp.]|uniref:OmpA family protein n=1 Tax=Phaeovulum sp. TaxID=2934796 RepID=UPI0027374CE3|nr:OmpA family protein [Phaeovulum sp.]MDP3861662.1 OmpA family protein [Phaeovulum sp.]